MAGRGEYGPRQGGFSGGRGNWNQGRGAQGDWTGWRGAPPANQMAGPGGSGGQFGQSFGYGFNPSDQRPSPPGTFPQGDFYNYSNGYYGTPQVQTGMNLSAPSDFSSVGRPMGNPVQIAGMQVGTVQGLVGAGGTAQSGAVVVVDNQKFPGNFSVGGKPVLGACYRCGAVGHGIKECKVVISCEICSKETHISANCVLPNQPKPVAALIGCGGEGLQMFTALTGKKIDPAKAKQAIALVSIHSGTINAQQLVDGFSKMFSWGWEWKARPYLNNRFLVKFPSVQKIDEMKGYEYFGIPGLNTAVKVSRWNNASMAKFKLYTVWVRITGIPESLLHYHGICEAASLIGKVREVDMKMFRQQEVVRVKVGVKDPRKIPSFAEINDEDFIYDIWFELEDIVEQGGPMLGGSLVINTGKLKNGGAEQIKNLEQKRSREDVEKAEEESCKSPKNDNDTIVTDDELEIASSQYELDKKLQEEIEAKKRSNLLKSHNCTRLGNCGDKTDEVSRDVSMTDQDIMDADGDSEENVTQDRDDFARKVRLGTQRIREINESVEAELDKENLRPKTALSGSSENGDKM